MYTLGNWLLTKTARAPVGCLWLAVTGCHHTLTILHSPSSTNSLVVSFIVALLCSCYHILLFFFLMNCLTFKILLFSVIPMEANANLPKERIDALIAVGVYHHNHSNARDLDSIYTTEAMQCSVGYALCPSFSDLAFAIAIRLAKEKIHQLEFSINQQLDIATKSNVDFDVDRTPESIRYREL